MSGLENFLGTATLLADLLSEARAVSGFLVWVSKLKPAERISDRKKQWIARIEFDERTLPWLNDFAAEDGEEVSKKDQGTLKRSVGAVVEQVNSGLYVSLYRTKDELDRGWGQTRLKYEWAGRTDRDTIKDIVTAMKARNTLRLHYQRARDNKVGFYEVEPYSFREGRKKFYGWDTDDRHTKSFFVKRIVAAVPTGHRFAASWPIEVVAASLDQNVDNLLLEDNRDVVLVARIVRVFQ